MSATVAPNCIHKDVIREFQPSKLLLCRPWSVQDGQAVFPHVFTVFVRHGCSTGRVHWLFRNKFSAKVPRLPRRWKLTHSHQICAAWISKLMWTAKLTETDRVDREQRKNWDLCPDWCTKAEGKVRGTACKTAGAAPNSSLWKPTVLKQLRQIECQVAERSVENPVIGLRYTTDGMTKQATNCSAGCAGPLCFCDFWQWRFWVSRIVTAVARIWQRNWRKTRWCHRCHHSRSEALMEAECLMERL